MLEKQGKKVIEAPELPTKKVEKYLSLFSQFDTGAQCSSPSTISQLGISGRMKAINSPHVPGGLMLNIMFLVLLLGGRSELKKERKVPSISGEQTERETDNKESAPARVGVLRWLELQHTLREES
jgi:hypothetical protein